MDWLQDALNKSQTDAETFRFQAAESQSQQNLPIPVTPEIPLVTPEHTGNERLLCNGQLNSQATTAYSFLCSKILQKMQASNQYTLAITSPISGNGKTLTAANIAISMARTLNEPIILVELNTKTSVFEDFFGFSTTAGLNHYLHKQDASALESTMLQLDTIEDLILIPAGTTELNNPHILGSKQIRNFVGELKARFPNQYIIFDTPPLLEANNTLAFLPNVDATLLIIEEGMNTKQQIIQCTDILQSHGFLGSMLNKSVEAI